MRACILVQAREVEASQIRVLVERNLQLKDVNSSSPVEEACWLNKVDTAHWSNEVHLKCMDGSIR